MKNFDDSSVQLILSNTTASRRLELWRQFCNEQNILIHSAPLFETNELYVVTKKYGKDQRTVLSRSRSMEKIVIEEVEKVIVDFPIKNGDLDGIIYMMFWKEGDLVVPLYIGKSEKFGLNSNLSANIASIRSNSGKFCRWGYNYAYHIGDLSAVVCPGHSELKVNYKYARWAKKLFVEYPSSSPILHRETYFWAKAWNHTYIGMWKEYGATSLTFLEYLLIGVASDLFPDHLLNSEGVNRK